MVKKIKKKYDPRDRWRARYNKEHKVWLATRKMAYLYWFKYLQWAELDNKRTVDWTKYDGWGGSNYILGTKFDDFWKEKFLDLFTIKNIGDIPRYPLSTTKPKIDSMRYSLKIYENRHRGSTWDIAVHFKKNEKRQYFLEFFDKIEKGQLKTKSKLVRQSQDVRVVEGIFEDVRIIKPDKDDKVEREEDFEAYLNSLDKADVQRQVGRYLKQAQTILNNVCKGQFP